MDWKQFFASVIGALGWPVVMLFGLLVFRKPLTHVIFQIKRVKAAGVDLEMQEKIEEVADAAKAVANEKGIEAPLPNALDSTMIALAEISPESAVVRAFKDLEAVILELRAVLPDLKPHRNVFETLKAARDQGFISSSVIALYQTLRGARNAAAHEKGEEELNTDEALDLMRQMKLLEHILRPVIAQLRVKQTPKT